MFLNALLQVMYLAVANPCSCVEHHSPGTQSLKAFSQAVEQCITGICTRATYQRNSTNSCTVFLSHVFQHDVFTYSSTECQDCCPQAVHA
mmetsp:Transcript_69870/g.163995  ORF Transcript_69870/g.163995 Transcript_69870/m.163995 type:complete len:90 (-) Transcript_69870:69-338(-)